MDSLCAASTTSSSQASAPRSPVDSSSSADSSAYADSAAAVAAVAAMGSGESTFLGGRGSRGRGTRSGSSRAWKIAVRLFCGLLTCVFAIVGSLVGAVVGALIGLATESGFFRGAGVGAISGAVFSIDAVESTLVIWRSRGMWSVVYVIDIIVSLLSGRLVREKVDPAVQNAVQSQMSAVVSPFHELPDIFETGAAATGMSRASVEEIPKIAVTAVNCVDSCGEKICCSVCLQDLQPGESVRSLPHCGHMFHIPCIDGWLLRHGSCPLCRRDFQGLRPGAAGAAAPPPPTAVESL